MPPPDKYPCTPYSPWSPANPRNRPAAYMARFVGREIVITEKLDGFNTLLRQGQAYTRSSDSAAAALARNPDLPAVPALHRGTPETLRELRRRNPDAPALRKKSHTEEVPSGQHSTAPGGNQTKIRTVRRSDALGN